MLERADLILHGGDFSAASVLAELEGYGPVAAVYGNADEPALKAILPKQRVVEVEGVRIGMVHIPGPRAGRDARLAARFPDCAAVIYGHTHVAELSQHDDVWILNPGSPTERRGSRVRSMLTLEIDGQTLRPRLHALP